MSLANHALMSLEKFAKMFLENHAEMFQEKSAETFQARAAGMWPNCSAKTSPSRSASQFLRNSARMSAWTPSGARFVPIKLPKLPLFFNFILGLYWLIIPVGRRI